MELNIFCINKKTKKKKTNYDWDLDWRSRATASGRRSRLRLKHRARAAGGDSGSTTGHWGEYYCCCCCSSCSLHACYFNSVAIVYHLICIWRSIACSRSIHRSIDRSIEPPRRLQFEMLLLLLLCFIRMPNCLRADNVKHLALALALRSASSVCQIRQRKWEMNPIPVSLTLSNLHTHTSLPLFSALSQLFFRTANRFIWLIYFRILNQMLWFARFTWVSARGFVVFTPSFTLRLKSRASLVRVA